VLDAFNLIANWKQERTGWRAPTADGVAFANVLDDKPKTPRDSKAHITCHRCNKKGHYASECPEKLEGATGGGTVPKTGTGVSTGAMLLNAGIASGEFDEPTAHFQFVNASKGDPARSAKMVNFQGLGYFLTTSQLWTFFATVTFSLMSEKTPNIWKFTVMPELRAPT
jgi:hypothetical protein